MAVDTVSLLFVLLLSYTYLSSKESYLMTSEASTASILITQGPASERLVLLASSEALTHDKHVLIRNHHVGDS